MAAEPIDPGYHEPFPHNCRRRRCAYRGAQLPGGQTHYPHKGATCHHQGEDPASCPVHGRPLHFYGARGTRYPAGLCYECLPPHQPTCPMVILPIGVTCTCPARLLLLGWTQRKGGRVELQETGS